MHAIDERTSEPHFNDINALWGFLADALNVVALHPFADLVDFVVEHATGAEYVGV